MGSKGGGGGTGGRGYGSATRKGPLSLGGPSGAGKWATGGGFQASVERITGPSPKGKKITLANYARTSGQSMDEALAEVDRLVKKGEAKYLTLSPNAAAILRAQGRVVAVRDGRPISGFELV
jgi:hypothetical protein